MVIKEKEKKYYAVGNDICVMKMCIISLSLQILYENLVYTLLFVLYVPFEKQKRVKRLSIIDLAVDIIQMFSNLS